MNDLLRVKRNLETNKGLYRKGLETLLRYFSIDISGYMKMYEEYSNEIINLLMEKEMINKRISEVDNKFGKIKMGLLLRENINLFEELEKVDYDERRRIVDDLFRNGFLSIEDTEMLKQHIWNGRYKPSFSD